MPVLSIVVPVLNEAPIIRGFLRHLREVAPAAEIIVVDGGSLDRTPLLAEALADVVITAARGRAAQMNAGAAIARGEVLWFLHADLRAPGGAAQMIKRALADERCVGGCFRLRFPARPWVYRISDSIGNIGVDVFGFALGDHGIFCRRSAFRAVGGYPVVPILEDAELYRRLRRAGRMRQLLPEIVCSPRTYETHGAYRTTAVYFLILALYVLRARISFLNRIHRSFMNAKPRGLGQGFPTRSTAVSGVGNRFGMSDEQHVEPGERGYRVARE